MKTRIAVKSYEEGPWRDFLEWENSFEEEKEGHLEKEDGNNLPTDFGKEPHL